MKDAWKERENAFEDQYIYDLEKKQLAEMKRQQQEQKIPELAKNHCPKCGEKLQAITFHDVPLDQCPTCHGVWLGPHDFQLLAANDHRTWFDLWFKQQDQ